MKKKLLFLCVLTLIAVVLTFSACKDKGNKTDELCYDMKVSLEGNVLSGTENVSFRNVYADVITDTVYHLYPNAYSLDATNPAYKTALETYGGIEIKSVSVDGEKADFSLSEDKEYLTVRHGEIKRNGSVNTTIEFVTTIPSGDLRLAADGKSYTLSGFYPQLSVYTDGAFRKDKFSAVGDPAFSGVADYKIEFECDKSLVIAASAKQGSVASTSDRQTVTYEGKNIRDFAIVCSPDYNVINGQANGVNVYYFYKNDENAQQTLDLAVNAVKTFGETFGAYPFDTYTVVRAPFVCDGMEYGGLALVGEKCGDVNDAVIHETAHQWWYGAVGSDCINESYMDEGLTTFTAAYYYELTGESEKFEKEINAIKRAYMSYERLQKRRNSTVSLSMNRPVYDFTDYQYTMVEYYKGCMMFENLYALYGKDKFNACLKKYYEDNKFGFGGKNAFVKAAKQTMGDVGGLMDGWISGNLVTATFGEE